MSITTPRKREPISNITKVADEEKIRAIINKGGSPTGDISNNEEIKQINIKLLSKEVESIKWLREKRPKARGAKRLAISLHDWIVEAINEKIERDKAE
jgi:hypothetical protein